MYTSGPGTDFECFYSSAFKDEDLGITLQDCTTHLSTSKNLYCLYSSVRPPPRAPAATLPIDPDYFRHPPRPQSGSVVVDANESCCDAAPTGVRTGRMKARDGNPAAPAHVFRRTVDAWRERDAVRRALKEEAGGRKTRRSA